MPKRVSLRIFTLACLLLWLAPVHAQASWQALLYDRTSGRMARVNDSGAAEEFTLPVSPGYDLFPDRVAVGHGGGPISYIPINQSTRAGQLVIVNTGDTTPLLTYDLPQRLLDSLLLRASENNFAPDNRSLAFGYSLLGGGWELVIFDLTSGMPATSLRSDNPLVTVLGLPVTGGYVPIVERYSGEQVAFSLVPEGAETALGWSSYLWNMTTGNITGDIAYPTQDNDTLVATGEVVMAMPDERLPNTSSAFSFGQSNALHVYDPALNARYPFYTAANLTFFRPTFVQNGERILTEADDAAQTHLWHLVERSGALVAEAIAPPYVNSAFGVPDGFVYAAASPGAATTTLYSVNTRVGLNAGLPLWTNATSDSWHIVWTGSLQASALAALPGWPQLATAVTGTGDPLGGVTFDAGGGTVFVAPVDLPTPAPASGGILVVGGQATINTTEGDTLNVRGGPGTSFEIVARLPDGARVTLLEGPRAGEGYSWWRIRAGSVEGWVVESVDDRGTRLQTLIP